MDINTKHSVVKSYQSDSMLECGIIKGQIITLPEEASKQYIGKELRFVQVLESTTGGDEYEYVKNSIKFTVEHGSPSQYGHAVLFQ